MCLLDHPPISVYHTSRMIVVPGLGEIPENHTKKKHFILVENKAYNQEKSESKLYRKEQKVVKEHVRLANSWAHPRPTESEALPLASQLCVF